MKAGLKGSWMRKLANASARGDGWLARSRRSASISSNSRASLTCGWLSGGTTAHVECVGSRASAASHRSLAARRRRPPLLDSWRTRSRRAGSEYGLAPMASSRSSPSRPSHTRRASHGDLQAGELESGTTGLRRWATMQGTSQRHRMHRRRGRNGDLSPIGPRGSTHDNRQPVAARTSWPTTRDRSARASASPRRPPQARRAALSWRSSPFESTAERPMILVIRGTGRTEKRIELDL